MYGPIIVNFQCTRNFLHIYLKRLRSFHSDKNPNRIFLEKYNYEEDKYEEEADTISQNAFHVMSIIG